MVYFNGINLFQALYCTPEEHFIYKALNGEFQNLRDYVERMKDKYWQDWDQCLAKTREEKRRIEKEEKEEAKKKEENDKEEAKKEKNKEDSSKEEKDKEEEKKED